MGGNDLARRMASGAILLAIFASPWGCSGAVASQFDAGSDDGASGDDAGGDSGGSSGSGSGGGACNPASCKACVLGQASCTSAGRCQCCLQGTCLPD